MPERHISPWARVIGIIVGGGFVVGGVYYATREAPPGIEAHFGNLEVIYEKVTQGETMMVTRYNQQVEEELQRLLNTGPTNLMLAVELPSSLGNPAYPIDCFPGDTIRSTFVFDFRGEAASYRFEVMMTETWHVDVALAWETLVLPRTEEIARTTVVIETQIPTNIYMSSVGTMYGAQATIHGAIGDIIWTPNVLNIFRVLPRAEYFANLAVAYNKV